MYGSAVLDGRLRKAIAFADHNLATDSAFAEVPLVPCRNVLIYFDRSLQDRAIGVLGDSLCRKGSRLVHRMRSRCADLPEAMT